MTRDSGRDNRWSALFRTSGCRTWSAVVSDRSHVSSRVFAKNLWWSMLGRFGAYIRQRRCLLSSEDVGLGLLLAIKIALP